MENKDTCPFCNQMGKYKTDLNIGFDIDPSGEEKQHRDVCECGAWRFWVERWEKFVDYGKHFGKWRAKDEPFFP